MRVYETTFVINPQTDDTSIDKQVVSVSDIITGGGGKILYENRMGTRRLAYPIQKLTQGYYTTFVYESTSDILPRLDRHFILGEEYLRHLTILFEGDLEKLLSRDEVEEPKHFQPKPKELDKPAMRRPDISNKPAGTIETSVPKSIETEPKPVEKPVTSEESAPVEEAKPKPIEEVVTSEESAPVEEAKPKPVEEPAAVEEPEKKISNDTSLADEYPEQEEEL
ncbi:MAG: 30S ribosomal protein S6 [Candidatus Zixiibacteriota bacterium]|nr:MAG: 30S ribosomal protein S6 [candidate division Zixibacteria bacterium]